MPPLWLLPVVGFIVYKLFSFYRRAWALPPGPFPLPFIGNLGTVLHPPRLNRDFSALAKKYGGIFTVHMPFPVVNICDYEALREINRGDDISDRMESVIKDMMMHAPNGGVVQSNGESWKEQRRVGLAILRDFGLGGNIMEEKISRSVHEMLEDFAARSDEELRTFEPRWTLQLFVSNVINEVMFGHRYVYNDCIPGMKFTQDWNKFGEELSSSSAFYACMSLPWLRFVPFIKEYAYDRHQRNWNKLMKFFREQTKACVADPHEPVCFVRDYLSRAEQNNNLNYQQLLQCVSDIFVAAQETTTTSTRWALLFLANNQDVQDKLRKEIFAVVGQHRMACMADKPKMPYTKATMHEILRRSNFVPFMFFIVRVATVDTEVKGFKIPKGTVINPDLHGILSADPAFEDPTRFWPERYLCEDGKTLRKDLVERTAAFGMGKRACMGEGLARDQLFLGVVSIVQHYRILPPLEGEIDLEPLYHFNHLPKTHKLCFERIHASCQ